MTVLRIPVRAEVPFYTQRTSLDGRSYLFTFKWNQRSGFWFFDFADQDEDPIVSGVKVVPEIPLLRRIIDERRPAGELIVTDLTGDGEPPGYSDFGDRMILMYVPYEDFP